MRGAKSGEIMWGGGERERESHLVASATSSDSEARALSESKMSEVNLGQLAGRQLPHHCTAIHYGAIRRCSQQIFKCKVGKNSTLPFHAVNRFPALLRARTHHQLFLMGG